MSMSAPLTLELIEALKKCSSTERAGLSAMCELIQVIKSMSTEDSRQLVNIINIICNADYDNMSDTTVVSDLNVHNNIEEPKAKASKVAKAPKAPKEPKANKEPKALKTKKEPKAKKDTKTSEEPDTNVVETSEEPDTTVETSEEHHCSNIAKEDLQYDSDAQENN